MTFQVTMCRAYDNAQSLACLQTGNKILMLQIFLQNKNTV